MPIVTQRYESAQYAGDFATILAFLDGAIYTVDSETAERLVLRDGEGTPKVIPAGGWVVRGASHELVWQGSNSAYLAQWAEVTP
jgi:hypothetical protein